MKRGTPLTLLIAATIALASGCAKHKEPLVSKCRYPSDLQSGAGDRGTARLFLIDPITRSGNPLVSPTDGNLDSYATDVALSRLGGLGVLEGTYVDVRNEIDCREGYGVYDAANRFAVSHDDPAFQEAMAYYYGDLYQYHLDNLHLLTTRVPVRVISHCMKQDQAFYFPEISGGVRHGNVCLGDSPSTLGASYSDDAEVEVHELQHGSTLDSYSANPQGSLNQFIYDEAGALNEAISDFMALAFAAPSVPSTLDPRVFSRWALGTFVPGDPGQRGAHWCPTYDAGFAAGCPDAPGFSADKDTVSFVYPDGKGWPYTGRYRSVRAALVQYQAQEEIHNAGVVMVGALWDMYSAIKSSRGDDLTANALSTRLVSEALRDLPQPRTDPGQMSPVTFRGFAQALVDHAAAVGLNIAEQNKVSQALGARADRHLSRPGPAE